MAKAGISWRNGSQQPRVCCFGGKPAAWASFSSRGKVSSECVPTHGLPPAPHTSYASKPHSQLHAYTRTQIIFSEYTASEYFVIIYTQNYHLLIVDTIITMNMNKASTNLHIKFAVSWTDWRLASDIRHETAIPLSWSYHWTLQARYKYLQTMNRVYLSKHDENGGTIVNSLDLNENSVKNIRVNSEQYVANRRAWLAK